MLNNKKTVTIVIAFIILFFSTTAVFFYTKRTGNKEAVNKNDFNIAEELKNIQPGISATQIRFYSDAAAKGSIAPCQGRADASDCVSAVAFIKGDRNLCDLLEQNEKLYQNCANNILKIKAGAEIVRCENLFGDDYYNCLGAVFVIYKETQDCVGLADQSTRIVCQDFFNYQTVYLKYDRSLCQSIKSEKINQYCLKNIIDKNQDSDKDGLTDLDEINKYKTHYLFADSDNDGINDGEAVKRGLIKVK